jgi:hypothetical protein
LPSGEKATDVTLYECPSSVCSAVFQFAYALDFIWTHGGTHFANLLRIILCSGAKTRAEQYSWRGACSIINRLYKANRFASWTNV